MSARLLLSALALASLTACGGINRHCQGEFEYQQAATLPAPEAIEGLRVPESPSALRIPPSPEQPVPFARESADPSKPGKMRTECLDVPPPLPPEPPENETPKS